MGKTPTALNNALRAKYTEIARAHFDSLGEDVQVTASNELSIPVLDEEGNEKWVVFTVKVPSGARDDDEGYDGYTKAQMYAEHVAEQSAKRAEAERKKQAKIERDKAQREAQAKKRAEHAMK